MDDVTERGEDVADRGEGVTERNEGVTEFLVPQPQDVLPPKKKRKPATGRRRGRPDYVPNEEHRTVIRWMAAGGIPHKEIIAVLGIGMSTLQKYYRKELDTAMGLANAKVIETLYRAATNAVVEEEVPDPTDPERTVTRVKEIRQPGVVACIYWTKARAGWIEANKLQLTGADDGPLVIRFSADDANL